jgi:hypothetical protein
MPQYQRAVAQYNTDPTAMTLGPYTAHDVGVSLLPFRDCVPVPHRYMHYCMKPLTVREGVEILAANIMGNGDGTNCATLLNFLMMAATIRNEGDTFSTLRRQPIPAAPADETLVTRWLRYVDTKLPGRMTSPVATAGVHVASAIGELVQEQRDARREAQQRSDRATVKTADSFFGAKSTLS